MILQSCPACQRQYDITHVAPGGRVRCACDRVMTVRIPDELTVRARKCSNCGGPVEGAEARCGYCGSGLNEIDLSATLCPRCFRRMEEDARHCQACGVAIEPQALTAIPEGTSCPRCGAGEPSLCLRSLGEACVVECPRCGGLWVTASAFDAVCQKAQDRPRFELGGPAPQAVSASEPERKVRYVPCLSCGELMNRRNFRYKGLPSQVIIDYCREHGVWLDRQELERVVAFIQSRANQSSTRPGFPPGGTLAPEPVNRPLPREPVSPGRLAGGLGPAPPGELTLGVLVALLGDLFD